MRRDAYTLAHTGTHADVGPHAGPQAHRRIGDSRQQSMWEDVNTPAHNTAVQSIMDSQAIRLGCEHTSRSTPLLNGNGLVRDRDSGDDHVNANKDLDLSDSDSDDDLTALTTDTQNTFARSAGDLSFADHELYQRAATIFPHVYGDRRRSLHTGTAIAFACRSAGRMLRKRSSARWMLRKRSTPSIFFRDSFVLGAIDCPHAQAKRLPMLPRLRHLDTTRAGRSRQLTTSRCMSTSPSRMMHWKATSASSRCGGSRPHSSLGVLFVD